MRGLRRSLLAGARCPLASCSLAGLVGAIVTAYLVRKQPLPYCFLLLQRQKRTMASEATPTRTIRRTMVTPCTSSSSFSASFTTSLTVSVSVLIPSLMMGVFLISSSINSYVYVFSLNKALIVYAESRPWSEAFAVINIWAGYLIINSFSWLSFYSSLAIVDVSPSTPEATYIKAPSARVSAFKTITSLSTASFGHLTS